MRCPQCQSDEIGASGICRVCGYKIAMASAAGANEPRVEEDLPRWRQELSERLSAIKQNKEIPCNPEPRKAESFVPPPEKDSTSVSRPPDVRQSLFEDRTHGDRPSPAPLRSAKKPRSPLPQQRTLAPLAQEAFPASPAPELADRQEIKNLIDSAVARQSVHLDMNIQASTQKSMPDNEGKWILLSRTLSGLIDLIFIVLCTGAFIISADYFSGIVILDFASLVDYGLLFLLTYYVYSLFFLATANQTIGMMITDLRVIGVGEKRPSMAQLFRRCSGYLVSVLGLGFGLLWSLFDRDSLCFHDRFSRTRVTRI